MLTDGADGSPTGGGSDVQATTDGDRLSFTGELDEVSIQVARDALDEATERGPVVLDLSGLRHLASVGISLLVATMRRVGPEGLVVVARPGSLADQVLDMYRIPHREA
jgi:anti-anti-sigma factor